MDLTSLRKSINKKISTIEAIEDDMDFDKEHLKTAEEEHEGLLEARDLLNEITLQTQDELASRLSALVSMGFKAIFDDPYTFKAEFSTRRNQSECDLLFERDGNLVDPISGTGGGAVDVSAFSLTTAYHSLRPEQRDVLILDEPLRNLSTDLVPAAIEMMREVSHKLGIQLIIVNHVPELTKAADKVFVVKGGEIVEEIQAE